MSNKNETILVIDDDRIFTQVLTRALAKRGFRSLSAHDAENAQQQALILKPDKIVLDLKLQETSGLSLIPLLLHAHPNSRIVILTGYSSISTAVEAIKLGAFNYLCKPADADQILAAFEATDNSQINIPPSKPPSLQRLTWEHIQKVLADHGGNISATARVLGMHRRSLQRKLQKRPVQY